MNIFILDESVERCAQSHCDKHVTKMIVEYAQILCTTHRYLDGSLYKAPSNSGKTFVKKWLLDDKEAEKTLFAAAYVNHPCTIWTRLASENYLYLYKKINYDQIKIITIRKIFRLWSRCWPC